MVFAFAAWKAGMQFDPKASLEDQLRSVFYANGQYIRNLVIARSGNLVFFVIAAMATWLAVMTRAVPTTARGTAISARRHARRVYPRTTGCMVKSSVARMPPVSPSARRAHVAIHYFIEGIRGLIALNREGHLGYLMGELRVTGWWYYFPIAFFLKTTIASMVLLLAGVFLAWRERAFGESMAAAQAILGVATSSNLDLGIRYALPMYVPRSFANPHRQQHRVGAGRAATRERGA